MAGSRISGFYRLSLDERRAEVCKRANVKQSELEQALAQGGLEAEAADKIVENVLGTYGLPFGIALNFTINGRDRLVPMVIEEPSVIAAASNAARMVRESGGFQARMLDTLMTAQVQLYEVSDRERAIAALQEASAELLELGRQAVPNLVRRGGGPRELQVRDLGDGHLVLHVNIDCKDAMGANLVNNVAEAVGARARDLSGGKLGLRILTNLCDQRRVHVSCRVRADALIKSTSSLLPPASSRPTTENGGAPATPSRDETPWPPPSGLSGQEVVQSIVQASNFAWRDPFRAATHNKGLMNGVDAVVLATGNDFRAVEAGVHAYAARNGRYEPLSRWTAEGDELVGEAVFPLALGSVGGTLGVHRAARMALSLAGVESASDLSQVAASAGLASNLAALRALGTEGIQRGHMALHARSVATLVGARGDEVEQVAASIVEAGTIHSEAARLALKRLRGIA